MEVEQDGDCTSMEMTRAMISATSLEELQTTITDWLLNRGLNGYVSLEFQGNSGAGTWYIGRVASPDRIVEFGVIERTNAEIKYRIEGEVNTCQYRIVYEFPRLMEDGPFVTEMVRSLLSQVGGYCINQKVVTIADCWKLIPKGYLWGSSRMLPTKEIPTEVSWEELFEYLGKTIQITNFDQYAAAVKRFKDKAAGRTNAFGG